VSTKNLSRTVIEGGRRASSRFARRHSHGPERASAHVLLRQLSTGLDPESAVFPGRPQVWKSFSDKLGPARRWLRSQAGRPWDKVRSELFARFDTRTTAGRHIVFDHLLKEVRPSRFDSRLPREFWISARGILHYRELVRPRPAAASWRRLDEPESVLRQWLGERRVIEQGARLYWLLRTAQGGFRQHHELAPADAARFRALPAWFRVQFEGPVSVGEGS
jgi:hypothetical protein